MGEGTASLVAMVQRAAECARQEIQAAQARYAARVIVEDSKDAIGGAGVTMVWAMALARSAEINMAMVDELAKGVSPTEAHDSVTERFHGARAGEAEHQRLAREQAELVSLYRAGEMDPKGGA